MKDKTRVLPLVVETALRGYLAPRLAHDAKLDLSRLTANLKASTWKADKGTIKAGLLRDSAGKMAKDADLGDVVAMLDQLDDVVAEVADAQTGETLDDVDLNDAADPAAPVDPVAADPKEDSPLDPTETTAPAEAPAALMDFLAGKLSDDDIAQVQAMFGGSNANAPAGPKPGGEDDAIDPAKPGQQFKGKDIDPKAKDALKPTPFNQASKEKPKVAPITQPAMDAAIKLAADAAARRAETTVIARLNAVRAAEREVRPWVGDLAIAQDSAEAVYRLALDSLGVDAKEVREVKALQLLLSVCPKPGDAQSRPVRQAMDTNAAADLAKRFPGVLSLKRS